ncbi:energy transducer TonB [Sphingomonas sp. SM33]|uniref:Energy transducer TonB n=1 Tax=Sphingomonas telluris TaxID=2907998 RepID=A0ABS9VLA8_9SPHN|nr:energy transducer TonB [Sphingomonas telluris]MCH8615751.1 energy transducer TonB [Sphingomonas telluris]
MFSGAFALAAVIVSGTTTAEPETRQPTAKWVVDFDDAQCVAYRNCGTEQDPIYLALKAPPIGEVMQLIVMRKGSAIQPEEATVRVTMGENSPLKKTMLVFRSDKAQYRTYLVNLPKADFAPFRTSSSLTIKSGSFNYNFALSDAGPLLKLVDECVTDLKKYWNVSEPGEKSPRLKEGAKGDLRDVFSSADYPWDALRFNEEGVTHIVALIDEKGAVADCTLINTSGAASLDGQACAIVSERAKFQPAIDLEGKPARDGLSQRIVWRMAF